MPLGESRIEIRKHLDEALGRPLGKEAAAEYDKENWGLSSDAIAAAEAQDALFADATYEEAA